MVPKFIKKVKAGLEHLTDGKTDPSPNHDPVVIGQRFIENGSSH